MLNWLLMVSDDGKADIVVKSPQDLTYATILIVGIIIGIIISFWFCQIKDYIKSKSQSKENESNNDKEQ